MNSPQEQKNRRILIIDDNPAIHEDFRKILCREPQVRSMTTAEAVLFGEHPMAGAGVAGFEIDSAAQGQRGLEMVEQARREGRPYAMAFIDVRMPPGWDGIETTEMIWKAYPDLQVVICTAYSDYSWGQMTERLGTSDRLLILKKPFDNVEVMQMASTLTEKWELEQLAKATVQDLQAKVEERTAESGADASRDSFRPDGSGNSR